MPKRHSLYDYLCRDSKHARFVRKPLRGSSDAPRNVHNAAAAKDVIHDEEEIPDDDRLFDFNEYEIDQWSMEAAAAIDSEEENNNQVTILGEDSTDSDDDGFTPLLQEEDRTDSDDEENGSAPLFQQEDSSDDSDEERNGSSFVDVLEIAGQDSEEFLPEHQTAITITLIVPFEQRFVQLGWREYHYSFAGGKKTTEETDVILRSVVKLLLRIYYTARQGAWPFVAFMTVYDFLIRLVKERALKVALNNTIEAYPFQNETLRVHLMHLVSALRWLETLSTLNFHRSKSLHDGMATLDVMLLSAMRGIKKVIRKSIRTRDNSMKTAVETGKYPPGGRQDFVVVVKSDFTLMVQQFAVGAAFVVITESFYNRFMELFMASLWVLSPQGRIGPIEAMNLDVLEELRSQGMTTSRHFKTSESSSKKMCVIMMPKTCLALLELYMKFLRPVVQPRNQVPKPTDAILYSYEGRRLDFVTRLVTSYFSRTMQLHVTSTSLRKIVESEVAQRTDLSRDQKDAVHAMVGHSRGIAEEFYIYGNVTNTARIAAAALELPGDNEMALVTAAVASPVYAARVWGKDHPDFAKPAGRKARWSTAEKDCISDIVLELQERPGKHETALMAEVLKVIKERVECLPIFHPTHVFNSARLRNGYAPLVQRKRSPSSEREGER